ncbi:MAG: glycosyltransferase family 39 protein, partial [Candidatus Acidiferrales bacterium]
MSAFTTSRSIPEGRAGFFRNAWAFFSRSEKLLLVLFLITLPMINPWVRGDGVGYYAFARAMLIEHRLDFRKDWLAANDSFRLNRIDASGEILPDQFTSTGHLDNHFSIGPAILWAPFLVTAHAAVLLADKLGASIPPDGFSRPYVYAMAFGTALYGFLAIWISFRLARKYLPEKWALLAALGIWFGSSLPVYMYFNPSWSHAHSAFVVALFLWYWDRTRGARTWTQWIILGAMGGLMMDVYYLNALVLLVPLFEVLPRFGQDWRAARGGVFARLLFQNVLFTG